MERAVDIQSILRVGHRVLLHFRDMPDMGRFEVMRIDYVNSQVELLEIDRPWFSRVVSISSFTSGYDQYCEFKKGCSIILQQVIDNILLE